MLRARHLILSSFVFGASLGWPGQARAEPAGVPKKFRCDQVTVLQAFDLGGGDWNYRYTANCYLGYRPKVEKKRDMGNGMVGPEPEAPDQTRGQILVTGVGTYRLKTNTVHEKAKLEGRLDHGPQAPHAMELDVQATYRCTTDPFIYKGGALCTRKTIVVKGDGWPLFKALTSTREAPFGTWGITLAVRAQVAIKAENGSPPPPPPPPPPKKQPPSKKPPKTKALKKKKKKPTTVTPTRFAPKTKVRKKRRTRRRRLRRKVRAG